MEPQPQNPQQFNCPYCSSPIGQADFFCPNCGKKLKEKLPSLSVSALLWLLVLSTLLPPLGILKTVSYIKAADEKTKLVGWISLFLTLGAIFVYIIYSINYFNEITRQINSQTGIYRF